MLLWAIVFFVIAVIAGVFGFTGILVSTSLAIAKGLFFLFLILFVISLIMNFMRRP